MDVKQFARRVAAIPDSTMRVRYVRSELLGLGAKAGAELLLVATVGAEAGDTQTRDLHLMLWLALSDPQCLELRRGMARVTVAAGYDQLTPILDPSSVESPTATPPAHGGPREARPLTLGERKALARNNDRELIARACRDPHPDVTRILLGNPAVTEDNVVRLCARRPVDPDALREVFRSTRWVLRYRVKVTLVKNPHAPLDVSLPLALHLAAPDAREVVRSGELPDELRRLCTRQREPITLH